MQHFSVAAAVAICNKLRMAKSRNPVIAQLLTVPMSAPYASQIASGKRKPSLEMALKIYQKTGLKFGKIADAKPQDIKATARALDAVAQ